MSSTRGHRRGVEEHGAEGSLVAKVQPGLENSMTRDGEEALELSTFIRETLVEIVKGVEQARDAVKEMETNAEICPTGLRFAKASPPSVPFKPGRGFVQEVEFDVAVTVSKEQSSEGTGKSGLSIGVPSIPWLGAVEAESNVALGRQRGRSEVSRVTFRVPVLLPSEVHPWNEEEKQRAVQ